MPFSVVQDVRYHYEVAGHGLPLLLLHGFTGSTENWSDHVVEFAQHNQVVTVDLPGHGLTDAPADPARYAMATVAADVIALLDAVTQQPVHLLGYSMGGRLALYMALEYPEKFHTLILESTSPGLATQAERIQRQQQDNALADRIERDGIEAFIDYWEAVPLFASQQQLASDIRSTLRNQRLRNLPGGLANSLRGMGTGTQPALWERLPALTIPMLLLAGELDTKFVGIARQMYALLPDGEISIVPSAGHTVHLEQPSKFQETLLTFLRGK